MFRFFNWKQKKDADPPTTSSESSDRSFAATDCTYPEIYRAVGRIKIGKAGFRAATYYLVCTKVLSYSRWDEEPIPELGLSSQGCFQPIVDEPVDADIWGDLLRIPPTHKFEIFYVPDNKLFPQKWLLRSWLNCATRTRSGDWVALQMCKFIRSQLLDPPNGWHLIDGVYSRIYGFWLMAAKAAYKRYWLDDYRAGG